MPVPWILRDTYQSSHSKKKKHTNSVNNRFSKRKLRRSLTLFQQNVGMNIRICCVHRKKHLNLYMNYEWLKSMVFMYIWGIWTLTETTIPTKAYGLIGAWNLLWLVSEQSGLVEVRGKLWVYRFNIFCIYIYTLPERNVAPENAWF